MRTVAELLVHLRNLGVRLWAEGDRLHLSAPKETLTPTLRAELTERKAEILTFLREANLASNVIPPPVQPVPRTEDLPLSFAQERLWFLNQLEGQSATYNIPMALRFSGAFNVTALEQSFAEMIRRHEALRTTFSVVDGSPVQVITSTQSVPLSVVDLQGLPEKEQSAKVQRLAAEEARRPFALEQGPLLRGTLLRLGAAEHVLLVTMHHIVSDGWSMGVFIRELSILYKAFLSDQHSPLPNLTIQYADFAYWQRQWLQGEVLEAQLAYWKEQLGGKLPVLELPTDRPRPPVQTFRGAIHSFVLPQTMIEALKTLSQEERATLFMTLLAAFKVLLYRYTGQTDIPVGIPVASRNRSEIEGLIGFFVNTLVLRTDLSGNPTFRELLRRVREVSLGAYDHQDMPFEKLVEVLQPERDLSHTPLFQVMFALQNAPMATLELPGLTWNPVEVESGTAKFDLTLFLTETGQGLTGKLEYNTDLFDAATMIRMAGHFQTLLAGIVADPEQRLLELPLLTEAERRQLLVEWNDTTTEYPQDQCIHQLFEAQVKRTPEAIAVVFEDQKLTYRELNHQANQLAHYLRALDVGPEVRVGVCMERSLEMVIGLCAVLKAGGAYVPLDPTYPQERLAYMLKDAQVPVLLTQGRLAKTLPRHGAQVICLDAEWEAVAQESTENLAGAVRDMNLAYVIYTSGSTGQPKGVMNTHRGIRNRLLWMQDAYQLTEADRVLQKTPFSFDVSVWEFFWPLLSGARLVVARPEGHKDSAYLVKLIAEQQITTIHFVPSMLQVFLEEQKLEACDCLRRVICSGEALSFELQERFFARLAEHVELYNLYGPTEAAIDVTCWTCKRGGERHVVPIGRPIANVQIYLLDSHLQPVPIGVPGELHIGGIGLARGYLNRFDLTAEKFIPNSFGDEPGARLYKTGDLARYLPDGNIEYLGRIDHQVKIRGFRIELGEIETVLAGHPAVREVAVIARNSDRVPGDIILKGDKRLVAYFVAAQEPAPTSSELRSFLKQKLPEYMAPSAFVRLEAMPLMPNGKVDRRALPAPDTSWPKLTRTYVAPRNPVEELLTNIWAEVLGGEQVGIYDNFFELGGHSLLATQLIFRVRETFQVELPLRAFFENATVAGLAQTIAIVRRIGPATMVTGTAVPDLNAEAVLDLTICPATVSAARVAELTAIFLTGATGFIGAFLLRELLQQTRANIYCLVRAADVEAGQQRIQRHLESYLLWQQGFGSRIIPVVGDLAQPYLGLSSQQFQTLASQIDIVYHSGALVNFVYPYYKLKPTNVLGTQEVLRLATQKAVPVHYISTLSVFDVLNCYDSQLIREEEELDHSECLLNGYTQSKWVAERLVTIARARGLPVCIYRPGPVIGDSRTGIWNTNDYVCRFIKGCIQLGGMPDQDKVWRLTPVDYVVKAIVHLSRQPTSQGKAFHILTPHHLHQSQLADWVRFLGYELQQISYDQWLAKLIKVAARSPDHALYPLLPFLMEQASMTDGEPQFDCQNLLDGLAGTAIFCPPVDVKLLSTYFSYFIRSGFLEPPRLGGKLEDVLKAKIEAISD